MLPARLSKLDVNSARTIKDHLKILGVPVERKYLCDCTERELWDLLEAAAAHYVYWRKQLHPDRGGDASEFADLHKAWKTLRRLFENHGYQLHKETINRDHLVVGRPFQKQLHVTKKKVRDPSVPHFPPDGKYAEELLEIAKQVDKDFPGKFGLEKTALSCRRAIARFWKVPDPSSKEHETLLRTLQYFSNSSIIAKRVSRNGTRKPDKPPPDLSKFR